MSSQSIPQIIPIPNKKIKNITGQRFGRLIALGFVGSIPVGRKRSGFAAWLCKCDCGNIKVVLGSNLRLGYSQSCGCLHTEIRIKTKTTHGMFGTPEYRTWRHMMTRCYNSASPKYITYGGRGITVCKQWHSFVNFFADMGIRPSSKHSLDRIDNNGNYEPRNCRWATQVQQSNNRRVNVYITYNGETHTIAEWARITGIKYATLQYRLSKKHWPVEKALTEPIRR